MLRIFLLSRTLAFDQIAHGKAGFGTELFEPLDDGGTSLRVLVLADLPLPFQPLDLQLEADDAFGDEATKSFGASATLHGVDREASWVSVRVLR